VTLAAAVAQTAYLSDGEQFLWGALGALIMFLVVLVLPELMKVWRNQADLEISFGRLVAAFFIAAILVVAGGALTLSYGQATEAKEAIAYGLGLEGLLGGSLKAFTP
jgi:hypothetical protein